MKYCIAYDKANLLWLVIDVEAALVVGKFASRKAAERYVGDACVTQ